MTRRPLAHPAVRTLVAISCAASLATSLVACASPASTPEAQALSQAAAPLLAPSAGSSLRPVATPEASAPSAPSAADDPGHLTALLQGRINRAIRAARAQGVNLTITSGWRSWQHQQALLDAAVTRYGSLAAATHWVLPPADSAHVRGMAVDVGPPSAALWLEKHGATYGLCRRYDNEPWHFEPLTKPGGTCPTREPHAVAR